MHIVNVPLPNASDQPEVSAAEVSALITLIKRTCGMKDRPVTTDMLAEALGVSRAALWSWMRKADPRPGKQPLGRNISYCTMYALQVLAVNPAAARADVFGPMWAAQGLGGADQMPPAPDTP